MDAENCSMQTYVRCSVKPQCMQITEWRDQNFHRDQYWDFFPRPKISSPRLGLFWDQNFWDRVSQNNKTDLSLFSNSYLTFKLARLKLIGKVSILRSLETGCHTHTYIQMSLKRALDVIWAFNHFPILSILWWSFQQEIATKTNYLHKNTNVICDDIRYLYILVLHVWCKKPWLHQ